ncbi:MAG: phosphotransferase [Roseiflexus sp.]|nr:phosphotransferase [Roseiflexus sp.]MCS7288778.1 phosphotransferase [Roseiflexus sp.]MDW8147324.1 phosphotransferase [Roseiflexaceae bacterium]MDW8233889.1 phosphotransferase [Roseiflexaceae bacterium]
MKRIAFTLLALALIVLLLGKSASRLAESITLCSIGLALTLGEIVRAAISRRVSRGIGVVARTRAVRQLQSASCLKRRTGRRSQAFDGVTVVLSRTDARATAQYHSAPRFAPGHRALALLRRTVLHEVLLAHDAYANRRVIIKRTLPGAPVHDLRREAGMLFWLEWARMPVPAPQYIAYEECDGRGTLTMSYIDGQTIEELAGAGRLTVSTLVHLLAKTCMALDALHRAGYVHQDIKPANLILDRNGTLAVIDWGSARRHDLPYDPRTITCTPDFASPEQLRGMVLPGNDLYAVGKTLAALVPAPPPALARVIARATGPFAHRYATGAELAQALLAAAHNDA